MSVPGRPGSLGRLLRPMPSRNPSRSPPAQPPSAPVRGALRSRAGRAITSLRTWPAHDRGRQQIRVAHAARITMKPASALVFVLLACLSRTAAAQAPLPAEPAMRALIARLQLEYLPGESGYFGFLGRSA